MTDNFIAHKYKTPVRHAWAGVMLDRGLVHVRAVRPGGRADRRGRSPRVRRAYGATVSWPRILAAGVHGGMDVEVRLAADQRLDEVFPVADAALGVRTQRRGGGRAGQDEVVGDVGWRRQIDHDRTGDARRADVEVAGRGAAGEVEDPDRVGDLPGGHVHEHFAGAGGAGVDQGRRFLSARQNGGEPYGLGLGLGAQSHQKGGGDQALGRWSHERLSFEGQVKVPRPVRGKYAVMAGFAPAPAP